MIYNSIIKSVAIIESTGIPAEKLVVKYNTSTTDDLLQVGIHNHWDLIKTDQIDANLKHLIKSVNDSQTVLLRHPKLNDLCFRRYDDTLIVNAQPYQRRSETELELCKQQCSQSQSGTYRCRSLVYDTNNQICDLFAHRGDKPPARLFNMRHYLYLEPNFSDDRCMANLSSKIKKGYDDKLKCSDGQLTKFLRVDGFLLHDHHGINLSSYSLETCIHACTNNQLFNDTKKWSCKSFDYFDNNCILSPNIAHANGSNQLRQTDNANYFEKFCINQSDWSDPCKIVHRQPQMILVGFAEAVIHAETLPECFQHCVNSMHLYGIRCSSGMFYYQESMHNCILNTENRETRPHLFISETSDIVDYFDAICT